MARNRELAEANDAERSNETTRSSEGKHWKLFDA
jgi:hypothetical protein